MNELLQFFREPWSLPISVTVGIVGLWVVQTYFPYLIKFGFDQRLEREKRELLQRDKSAIISDLIVALRADPKDNAEADRIDKILLDLCLYLPPCLCHKLAHTVCRSGTAEDLGPLGLFVEIRSFIDGAYKKDKKRKLEAANIPLTKRGIRIWILFRTILPQQEQAKLKVMLEQLELLRLASPPEASNTETKCQETPATS